MKTLAEWTKEDIDAVLFNEQGLVPAVIQDAATKQVLTLAYMNAESLALTVERGEVWLYSRSRQELWHKGATSGNTQKVLGIATDCDSDALLLAVAPQGPACHTGATSCFGQDSVGEDSVGQGILARLQERIAEREAERPAGAYTTYLFEKGLDKILKKVGEETAEVIIAAKNRDPAELRYEVADLFFHVLVLLREQKLDIADVFAELSGRYNPS